MRVALSQLNAILGDFETNRKRICSEILRAKKENCDLIVFPEAVLFGYHPFDLLERESIVSQQLRELQKIEKQIPEGISALVGAMTVNPGKGKPWQNSAVLIRKGKKSRIFAKELLPTYDVFDEARHIEPGQTKKNFFRLKGKKILVTVCEDIWAWPSKAFAKYTAHAKNPLREISSSEVDFVVNLSASPLTDTKTISRSFVVKKTATHFRAPMVYVNMVGAQDELIFDGGSFAVNSKGDSLVSAKRFEEDFLLFEPFEKKNKMPSPVGPKAHSKVEVHRRGLSLGLRDFVHKTGFEKVHLGLSGGIDSAVVAALAVEALGSQNVRAFYLPSQFSSDQSLRLATRLAENLKIQLQTADIWPSYETLLGSFEGVHGEAEFSIVNENLQARLRGVFLMAHSNKEQSLLIGTSNKCELAVGYSTLYGDLCGALLPIGDLLKQEVIRLAEGFNEFHKREMIPLELIERPPTAELRPDQTDEDSLPPYSELDPVVEGLVESQSKAKSALEKRVLLMMMKTEFKRWQAAPILKISDHAFGRGRRLPIAHRAFF